MAAGGKELPQTLCRARYRTGPRDAEGVEAMGAGGVGQRVLGLSRCQKSRLA
jgi:hypothetical protein